MAGLTIPFAMERERLSPIRVPIRNLAFGQGDDVALQVTLYEADGTPSDLSTATVTASVCCDQSRGWRGDYGFSHRAGAMIPLFQAEGAILDGLTGTATITIPRSTTSDWRGRYALQIDVDDAFAGAISAQGVISVHPGVVFLRGASPGTVSIGDGVLSDVPASAGYSRTATFPVTLAAPATTTVIVGWTTQDGAASTDGRTIPALAGIDYAASSGVVTFAAGSAVASVSVGVRGDDPDRQRSQFRVLLTSRRLAVLARAGATQIIPGFTVDGIGEFAIGVSGIGRNSA